MKSQILFITLLISVFTISCKDGFYNELDSLLAESKRPVKTIGEEDIEHLPELMRNYLNNIRLVGAMDHYNVWFYYTGSFKLNDGASWKHAEASTYDTRAPLSRYFVTEINSSMGKMSGVDTYYNGEGHMSIRYFSGLSFLEEDGPKLDSSELVTILADFPICPAFFLEDNLTYEPLSDTSLKVTITDAGMQCSGIFIFDQQGYISKFITYNRYEKESDPNPTEWEVNYNNYANYNGLMVPGYLEAGWKKESVVALYAKVNLTAVEYNINTFR